MNGSICLKYNQTEFEELTLGDPVVNYQTVAVIVAATGLTVTVIFFFTVLNVIRKRCLYGRCYIFLLNRAVADMLACIAVIGTATLCMIFDWQRYRSVTGVESTIFYGCYFVVMATYVTLNLLNCYVVARPNNLQRSLTDIRCACLASMSWIFFFVLVLSTAIGAAVHGKICWFEACSLKFYIVRYSLSIILALCYIAAVILFVLIIVRQNSSSSSSSSTGRRFFYSLIVLALNGILFSITYLPYAVWSLFFLFKAHNCHYLDHRRQMIQIYSIIRIMILTRIVVDPILSFVADPKIRNELLKLVRPKLIRVVEILEILLNDGGSGGNERPSTHASETFATEIMSDSRIRVKFWRSKLTPPVLEAGSITTVEKLGEGITSIVYSAYVGRSTGHRYALKTFKAYCDNEAIENEARLLYNIDSRNIVRLIAIVNCNEGSLQLLFELMNLDNLARFLRQRAPVVDGYVLERQASSSGDNLGQRYETLTVDELLDISYQIASGVAYLAEQRIVHRDIAARNCLVSGSDCDSSSNNKESTTAKAARTGFVVKLSDFGMSRRLYFEEHINVHNNEQSSIVLPLQWLAPECHPRWEFTHASDIWSFGVTLWEVFTYGKTPYGDLIPDMHTFMTEIRSHGCRLSKPVHCPGEYCKDITPSPVFG